MLKSTYVPGFGHHLPRENHETAARAREAMTKQKLLAETFHKGDKVTVAGGHRIFTVKRTTIEGRVLMEEGRQDYNPYTLKKQP